jgi:hypothetical protein
MATLEHECPESVLGEYGGARQTVVAPTDDDDVELVRQIGF